MSWKAKAPVVLRLDAKRGAGRSQEFAEHDEEEQRRRLALIGQFACGTAHDIGNLLAAITMALEQLRGSQRTGRLEEAVERALAAAQEGMAATRALLRTASNQAAASEIFDPNACIRGVAALLRQVAGPRIRLRLALAPNVWQVMADRHAAVLALLNLATNARDAMPIGGDILLTTANATLRRQVEGLTGDFVALTVADTGKGMPAAVVSHACRPFFTTKSSGQGTGLGLTQVCDFARRSRGAITIESKLERGSAVTLYLPRATTH
jgi:signal transduction histidine kinase